MNVLFSVKLVLAAAVAATHTLIYQVEMSMMGADTPNKHETISNIYTKDKDCVRKGIAKKKKNKTMCVCVALRLNTMKWNKIKIYKTIKS